MSGSQNGKSSNGNIPPSGAAGAAQSPGHSPPPGGEGSGVGGATPGDGGSIFTHAPPEGHAKKTSEVLGEIVWLMSQSGTFCCAIAPLLSTLHKQMVIQDLEWPAAQAAS